MLASKSSSLLDPQLRARSLLCRFWMQQLFLKNTDRLICAVNLLMTENFIILTLIDMRKIKEVHLGWNIFSQRTMIKITLIRIIDLIRSQQIELDVLSHMCNIVNSWSFTHYIASTYCIWNAQVTQFKENEGGAVTTE